MQSNKENIQKLVDALRSKKYTKTKHKLRRDENGVVCYCAEGVACEISGLGEWVDNKYVYRGIRRGSIIHHRVLEDFYGIEDSFIIRLNDEQYDKTGCVTYDAPLRLLNDGGFSFFEIADLLEQTYLKD